jgi:glycosyltransferase involved in cell wall biosynthesis
LNTISNSKKKILFILDSPYPPVNRFNRTLINRAELLNEKLKGVEIHFLSRGMVYSNFKTQDFTVHRVGFKKEMGIERFDSIIERIRFTLKSLVYLQKISRDVDLVVSMAFVANFTSFLLFCISRKDYLCDLVDFSFDADLAENQNSRILHRIPNKLLEYVECKIIPKYAKRVIVVSELMKKILVEKYRIEEDKITILCEGIDPRILSWKKEEDLEKSTWLRKTCELYNKKVLMITGFFDRFDRVDLLLRAFKELRLRHSDLKLVIAGTGDPHFESLMKGVSDPDIIVVGWQKSRRDAYRILQLADVCIIPMEKRLATDVIYSSKLMDYVAFRKPIVAFDLETIAGIVKEYDIGEIAESVDHYALAEAIEKTITNLDKYSDEKFENLIAKFSMQNISMLYPKLIGDVLAE